MGQHVDVAMAATLALNERLHSALSDIDRDGEPDALSAAQSPIFRMPGGTRITIVCRPTYTPSSTSTAPHAQGKAAGLAVGILRTTCHPSSP
jgi:hypothetical protein